jgi:hypothetical protein
MKKLIFSCFTGISLCCTIATSYSQSPNNIAMHELSPEKLNSTIEESNTISDTASIALNEISTKAVRSFLRDYGTIAGAKWTRSANGSFVVYFMSKGIKNRVSYGKSGVYEFTIRDYDEEKLPTEVRKLIRSNYYDFNIYHVREIGIKGTIAFILKLEDKTSWKTIKVVDGEMEVTEQYSKK